MPVVEVPAIVVPRKMWKSERGLLALGWLLDDIARVPRIYPEHVDAYLRQTMARVGERESDMPVPMTFEDLTEAELLCLQVYSLGTPIEKVHTLIEQGHETVKTHFTKARDKMGLPSTGHAACEALRLGLIH